MRYHIDLEDQNLGEIELQTEYCYFCKSKNIVHINKKCMNEEIGTFRKCNDCHAGEAIQFDPTARLEN